MWKQTKSFKNTNRLFILFFALQVKIILNIVDLRLK